MAIKKNIIIISIIILILYCASVLNKNIPKPNLKISKQDSALNLSPYIIKVLDLGQQRLLSNVFWISTLIESDLEHYKNKDLNSWLFLRFNTISILDPLFKRNYQFGGQYLNIIKDDLYGAEIIFKKGLEVYPDDFELNFNTGFLYAFELQDYSKAIGVYEHLITLPRSPSYIKSILNKLKFQKTGDLSLAFTLVKKTLENAKSPILIEKLNADLYAIKATQDLECLNTNQDGCEIKDYLGNKYILKDEKWISKKDFVPYQLFNKKKEANK